MNVPMGYAPATTCCWSRLCSFFTFWRRFFSPYSHKWQNLQSTPFWQPFVYKNAQGLQASM